MGCKRKDLLAAVLMIALAGVVDVTPAEGLDPESMDCLSCHDASVAKDITLEVCPEPGCDHPIEIDYAYMSAGNHGLTPILSLNRAIKLINDEIGCTTCHVPYLDVDHQVLTDLRHQYPSIPDPMLVMDNSVSQLCFACHNK